MSVRLPSALHYAAHVEVEYLWLPRLAPQLPLPIPLPLEMGSPTSDFPWPWMINRWLVGEPAAVDRIDDLEHFAEDLADFLNALRSVDSNNAPSPGPDNFYRGGNLSVYDAETRACIRELADILDANAVTAAWEAGLTAGWEGIPQWIHGDVAVGNLLVSRGRLSAVIDFGQLAAGDPSCDVTIAWTLFSETSRKAFRKMLSVDEATWARGRSWGLWKALLQLRTYRHTDPAESERAKRVIDDILSE